MKIEFITKNYPLNDKFKDIVQAKLSRLEKYFDTDVKVKVHTKQEHDTYVLELTIFAKDLMRAEVKNIKDMFVNIDSAIEKLVRQIVKHKSRLQDKAIKEFNHNKEFLLNPNAAEDKKAALVKTKVYDLSPMSVDEAIVKLDLVGHDFYVFYNRDTEFVNVLYKRKDGDIGVIEARV